MILADAHARHQQAVASYLATAAAVPPASWHADRAQGKWSAAAITQHLTLGFRAFEQDVNGGPPMQQRLKGWKLLFARWKYMRRILADGQFPSGARAPRETRPAGNLLPQSESLAQLQLAATSCERQILAAHQTHPDVKLTHPYFGRVSLAQAFFISAKHIEHHRQQLT
jgi:hypothetical protein